MPKYNESQVAGESWRRSFQLIGDNEYGQSPSIAFNEEDVVLLEDGKLLKNYSGKVGTVLTPENALEQFQLRNPLTEEYIEAYATYQDLFVLVHSLYFHLAQKRDRGPQPYPSWTWNDTSKQWEAPVLKPEGDWWSWDEVGQVWTDSRPPMPDDGQTYTWNGSEWVVESNGT